MIERREEKRIIEKKELMMKEIKDIAVMASNGVKDEEIRRIYGLTKKEYRELGKGYIGQVIREGRRGICIEMERKLVENIGKELDEGISDGARWYLERVRPEIFSAKGRLEVDVKGIESIIKAKEEEE